MRLGAAFAAPLGAEVVVLGVAERPEDELALQEALEKQTSSLRAENVSARIEMCAGDPVSQITRVAAKTKYDLVIVGARKTGATGLYWRSAKMYELIKAISPPVLVAVGEWAQLKRFLVCTGGKEFIEEAVQLTGKLAKAVQASVTLLHVMAEPPAMYADLVRLEEDIERLMASKSELGMNLSTQKGDLEKIGVPAEVRIRHGIVVDQVFAEARAQQYDLIVTGSSRARGMLRHYIMGDLTRTILNHADCPVLVARAGAMAGPLGLWRSIRRAFTTKSS